MTLPFVSYGSSSLIAQLWMLGMLTGLGEGKIVKFPSRKWFLGGFGRLCYHIR